MTKKDDAIIDILRTVKEENPDSFVYVLPNYLTKKVKSFMLIHQDLQTMIGVTNKLIGFQSENPPDDVLCFALWQSIIVTYGKCFTENKAGMSKLEKALLNGEDLKYQNLHDKLMDLRHSYIAHRDDTEKEQAVVFMKLPKEKDLGENIEYQIRSRKLQSPGVNVLQTYIDLFSVLSEIVELKIQKHNQKTHSAFIEQVPPERSHFFLINNMLDSD